MDSHWHNLKLADTRSFLQRISGQQVDRTARRAASNSATPASASEASQPHVSQPGSTLSDFTKAQNATGRELLSRLNDNELNPDDDLTTVTHHEVSCSVSISSTVSTSGTILPSYQISDLPSYKSKTNFGMHNSTASLSGEGTTPAYKINTNFGMHDSAASLSGDGSTLAYNTNRYFGMHDSAASLSGDGTTPATAGPNTSKGKGKQQASTVNAVHRSPPIDVIDPTRPRLSSKTLPPPLDPLAAPPRTIEDFAKTSRSGEEAAYKLDQAKGFNEWRPLNSGIDAGRDLLSTSYPHKHFGEYLRHLRTPTPITEAFASAMPSAFGGLESSRYATSTQSSTRHSSVSSGTFFEMDMSRPNSVKPSFREPLSQKVPYYVRRARAEHKAAGIDRQILQNKLRENIPKEMPLFPFSRTPSPLPTPPADSRRGSPRPMSPPSPKHQDASSSTIIFAPQPVSPAVNRKSFITEGLEQAKNEQNELNDVFAILPISAMSQVVSAHPSTFSVPSALSAPPAANINPAVSIPVGTAAIGEGRGGVRRKKKTMTVKMADDTAVVAPSVVVHPAPAMSPLVEGVRALRISANIS